MQDVELAFDDVDEGEEDIAIDAIFIEVIRRAVRGGDNGDTVFQHPFEQAAHDHRIGNVGNLHFVKTQKFGGVCDLLGHLWQRVGRAFHPFLF